LDVSVNTLRDAIQKHDDFPVILRGSKGVPYEFDLHAVTQWWHERKMAKATAKDQRRSELARLRSQFSAFGGEDRCSRYRGVACGVRQAATRPRPAAVWLAPSAPIVDRCSSHGSKAPAD